MKCVIFYTLAFLVFVSGDTGVVIPPSFDSEPEKEYIYHGTSNSVIELPCEAASPDKVQITYEWYYNSDPLEVNSPGSPWKLVSDDGGTIKNTDLRNSNEGFYQCYASKKYPSAAKAMIAQSSTAHLRPALLSALDKTRTTVDVTEYQSAKLECRVDTSGDTRSYPEPLHSWKTVKNENDQNPTSVNTDNRIQIDMNGALHFAYTKQSDEANGYLYQCNKFNSFLQTTIGGSHTILNVNPASGTDQAPKEQFGFPEEVLAIKDEKIELRCFFSGYPEPRIAWKRTDGKSFDNRRVDLDNHDTSLIIRDIEPGDETGYECTGSNTAGSDSKIIQLKVEEEPNFIPQFLSVDPHEPKDLNKTEGESVTFYCETTAIPEASVQWYINAELLQADSPGPRRKISDDGQRLEITDLCKDCGGGETDIMVIQCNASNVHGYAYGQGYLNVLLATKITEAPEDVEVDDINSPVKFECKAMTDDSTPLEMKWIFGGAEIDPNKPYYNLRENDEILDIFLNKSGDPASLEGDYKCEVKNGYSSEEQSANLKLNIKGISTPAPIQGATVLDYWWVFLLGIILIALIIILIILIYCYCCLKGEYYAGKIEEKTTFIDVKKDINGMAFHAYERPDDLAPLTPHNMASERSDSESGSLDDYGEPDVTKFNEDGSFMLPENNQLYPTNPGTIV